MNAAPGTVRRIICVGSRHQPQDWVGPAVFEELAGEELPPEVELIDGGLAGLDLLRLMPPGARVVLVDRLIGFGDPGEVAVLEREEAAGLTGERFDHAAGLPYLLRVLPAVGGEPLPRVTLVGADGEPDRELVRRVARRARVEVCS